MGTMPEELVVFMHERTSPAGHRRLVVVHATIDLPEQTVRFHPIVYILGSFGGPLGEAPPPPMGGRFTGFVGHTTPTISPLLFEDRPWLRLFAGRPDPAHAARFTVEFERCVRRER